MLGVCLKYAILPVVVDSLLSSQLKLEPANDETWEAWITPPVTPYMKFTFFQVLVSIKLLKQTFSFEDREDEVYKQL